MSSLAASVRQTLLQRSVTNRAALEKAYSDKNEKEIRLVRKRMLQDDRETVISRLNPYLPILAREINAKLREAHAEMVKDPAVVSLIQEKKRKLGDIIVHIGEIEGALQVPCLALDDLKRQTSVSRLQRTSRGLRVISSAKTTACKVCKEQRMVGPLYFHLSLMSLSVAYCPFENKHLQISKYHHVFEGACLDCAVLLSATMLSLRQICQ